MMRRLKKKMVPVAPLTVHLSHHSPPRTPMRHRHGRGRQRDTRRFAIAGTARGSSTRRAGGGKREHGEQASVPRLARMERRKPRSQIEPRAVHARRVGAPRTRESRIVTNSYDESTVEARATSRPDRRAGREHSHRGSATVHLQRTECRHTPLACRAAPPRAGRCERPPPAARLWQPSRSLSAPVAMQRAVSARRERTVK